MSELIFEKVGDINYKYPYLYVYTRGAANPFMEIAVSDIKKLEFTIYQNLENILLGVEQWGEILKKAEAFLFEAIENVDLED